MASSIVLRRQERRSTHKSGPWLQLFAGALTLAVAVTAVVAAASVAVVIGVYNYFASGLPALPMPLSLLALTFRAGSAPFYDRRRPFR